MWVTDHVRIVPTRFTLRSYDGMEFNKTAIKWLRKMFAMMKVVATAMGIAATA